MTRHQASTPGLYRRENAFDAIRLFLALLVIFAHSFPLGGFGDDPGGEFFQHQMLLGHLAVLGFFGLSGFLVAASCERSAGIVDFLRKRLSRILPGYWCCLLVCVFVFAPLIDSANGASGSLAWFGVGSATGFFVHNAWLMIRQESIGAILHGLPHVKSLNGSLWSLWPECFCYIALGGVALAGGFARNRPLLLIGGVVLLVFHVVREISRDAHFPMMPLLIDQTIYASFFVSFAVGVLLYVWRDHFTPGPLATAVIAFVTLYLLRTGGFRIVGPVLVPLLVIFAGASFRLHLSSDFSYGLYIYSFPVQHLVAAIAPSAPWFLFLCASLMLSFAFAVPSWFLVERRFLTSRTAAVSIPPAV